MSTMNLNNDDIRCGLFKEVRVNCNYIRHMYSEWKNKEFEVDEEIEEAFWAEYNNIICHRLGDQSEEEYLMDSLEEHIANSNDWVTETNIDDTSEEESESDEDEEEAKCYFCSNKRKEPITLKLYKRLGGNDKKYPKSTVICNLCIDQVQHMGGATWE